MGGRMKIINKKYKKNKKNKNAYRIALFSKLVGHSINNIQDNVESVPFDDIRQKISKIKYSDEFGKLNVNDITDNIIKKIADENGIAYE